MTPNSAIKVRLVECSMMPHFFNVAQPYGKSGLEEAKFCPFDHST